MREVLEAAPGEEGWKGLMKCVACRKRKKSTEFPPQGLTCVKCMGRGTRSKIVLPTRRDKARNRRFLKGWS